MGRHPGDPLAARRVFINNNTNGTPDESGHSWQLRLDLARPVARLGRAPVNLGLGVRKAFFTGTFDYIGGNENFDVTCRPWGVGFAFDTAFAISRGSDLTLAMGLDRYFGATLEGHDTAYSPAGSAMEQGVHATFMPKPLADVQGSGMHTHLSLFKDDANAFHDPDQPYLLSKTGQSFVAGLLRHAAELTAVTNQLVNSYKRLIVGTEAPSQITWARHHRAALVRVPVSKAGKEDAVRVEYRSPDPACNPYLAYSLLLAAGLKGVTEGYELPGEASTLFDLSPTERAAAGVTDLPQSLAEALDAMEGSELVRETLGDHIFEWFLRNKRREWADYKAQVTPFELARYLPTW